MPYLSGINFDNGLNPNALYTNMAENIAHFRAKRAERTNMLNQSQQLLTTSGRDKNVSVVVDEDNRVHAVGKDGKEDANAMQALYGNKKTDLSMNGKGTSVNKTIDVNKTAALAGIGNAVSGDANTTNPTLGVIHNAATKLSKDIPINANEFLNRDIARGSSVSNSNQLTDAATQVPGIQQQNTDSISRMQNGGAVQPNTKQSANSSISAGQSKGGSEKLQYELSATHDNADVKIDPVTKTVQTVDNSFNDEIQTSLQDLQYQQGMASMLGHGDQGIANTYAQMFQKRAADLNAQNALKNQNGISVVEDGGKVDIKGSKDTAKISQNMGQSQNISIQTNVKGGATNVNNGPNDDVTAGVTAVALNNSKLSGTTKNGVTTFGGGQNIPDEDSLLRTASMLGGGYDKQVSKQANGANIITFKGPGGVIKVSQPDPSKAEYTLISGTVNADAVRSNSSISSTYKTGTATSGDDITANVAGKRSDINLKKGEQTIKVSEHELAKRNFKETLRANQVKEGN